MKCLNSSATNQFLVVLSASLLIVSFGTSCGWPSFSFLVLESEDTPLKSGPLTTEELSWIVSIFCFGGIAGNFLFGWLVDKLGRKQILYVLAIPQIFSWILVIFAQNSIYLYASRLLVGITGGGGYIITPIIIAEVSEDRVRGMLGSILPLACNAGILIAFIIGHFFEYKLVPQILLGIPILYVVSIASFPETPSYLLKINRSEDAEKSFKFYRNIERKSQMTESFRDEFNQLQNKYSQQNEKICKSTLSWMDFSMCGSEPIFKEFLKIGSESKTSQKALFIAITIIIINECCGAFILVSYTATIFATSGSVLSPNLSAIIVGLIQFIGTYISTIYIDKAGRKFLLILSSVGTGIGNLCLGTYIYLNTVWKFDLSMLDWIPIVSFSLIVLLASIVLNPISYVYIIEIMPEKLQSIGTAITLAMSWITGFIVLKFFATLSLLIGMHSCILFFALISFSGTIFIIYVMPETMGRSFADIQKKLEAAGLNVDMDAGKLSYTYTPRYILHIAVIYYFVTGAVFLALATKIFVSSFYTKTL